MKRYLRVALMIFGLIFICVSAGFAQEDKVNIEDLYQRLKNLEKRVDDPEKKPDGLLDKVSEQVTFSGAIDLDFSYKNPQDIAGEKSDSTSDLDVGTVALGFEVAFHDWITGNFVLKGENLDTDNKVFWDEVAITIGNEGFPLYFVAGKRGQPFGLFESHLINDPLTQDCYEITETGATVGFAPGVLGIDISMTAYRGETLIEHLNDAGVGFTRAGAEDTDDVSSFIGNATMEPLGGLLLAVYWNTEPGIDDRNETAGVTVHYEFWKIALDWEYIGALQREKTYDGSEHTESAWFAGSAFQVTDSLEVALRYEAYSDDIGGEQNEHLENRYSIGANYTLFERDNFSTTLMIEYRKSNYEKAPGSSAHDEADEFFSRLAIAF